MAVPVLAQIESAIEQAERLSGHNDRVLFLLTLILFFVVGGVAVRWFMIQLDRRDKRIEELQQEISKVRSEFNSYLQSASCEMYAIIARNTDTIERNSRVIETHLNIKP